MSVTELDGIANLLNVLVATLALVVACTSIWLTHRSLTLQTRHNQLSLRPIPQISVGDYADHVFVKIKNCGPGTLIITRTVVTGDDTVHPDIISHMPPAPQGIYWSDYITTTDGRAIQSGEELYLICLEGDVSDRKYLAYRDLCRKKLSPLKVCIEYTDTYNLDYPACDRDLSWFSVPKPPSK